jgi:sigma-B regulation protein RsbU (phosphoserine phosphatase)
LADKVEIAASMTAAKDVGGDFYDFFKIDDEHIGFTIADVSGKGIPAAIFMAVSRTLIRATALHGVSPAECMTYSNKLLAKESVNCMFVTVFYGIYNTTTGEVNYCNAGHNPPYIIKNNGEVKAFPMPSQPIVGILSEYDFEEEKMKLEKGDALFLFTDGVTEAMNPTFEEFGEPRFEETLRKAASLDCQAIIDATKTDLAAFVGDAEQSDDITMLALRRLD